jgi:hypothetical protein
MKTNTAGSRLAMPRAGKKRRRKRDFAEGEMIPDPALVKLLVSFTATIALLFGALEAHKRRQQCPSKELPAPNTIDLQAVDVTPSGKACPPA